jgi:hypothetical protein
MFGRLSLSIVALFAGIALASFFPALSQWLRTITTFPSMLSKEGAQGPHTHEQ